MRQATICVRVLKQEDGHMIDAHFQKLFSLGLNI